MVSEVILLLFSASDDVRKSKNEQFSNNVRNLRGVTLRPSDTNSVVQTRSGRVVKPVRRLIDEME